MKTYYVDCTGNPAMRDELLDYAVERGAIDKGDDKYKDGHHYKWPCAFMEHDGVWCGVTPSLDTKLITPATWKRKVRKIWGGKAAPKKAAPKKAANVKETVTMDRVHFLVTEVSGKLDRIGDRLADIEISVALLQSGASFMQELEQATKPIGLQPGDHCSGTPEELKEVADELTEMGWGWCDDDRYELPYITAGPNGAKGGKMLNSSMRWTTPLDRNTFLSRARVTAAELGLTPAKEPQP